MARRVACRWFLECLLSLCFFLGWWMRNVEAGLGRGEGGSERIREAWGEGGWS